MGSMTGEGITRKPPCHSSLTRRPPSLAREEGLHHLLTIRIYSYYRIPVIRRSQPWLVDSRGG